MAIGRIGSNWKSSRLKFGLGRLLNHYFVLTFLFFLGILCLVPIYSRPAWCSGQGTNGATAKSRESQGICYLLPESKLLEIWLGPRREFRSRIAKSNCCLASKFAHLF